ncbi:AAA family ATPase [Streptomyces sp. URMC 125]|uniref:AAA family ATPase n=1 Tax=Streptomyces sp. URMC 125 TaxID=3423419 RepID=UPI003F1E16B6
MINHIKLINFKAFRRLELPLGPLTLLTGLNSSGKSSVLQALGLLRQSYETQMLTRTKRAGGGLLLNGDLVALGTAQDVLHEDFGPVEELPAVDEPLVGFAVEEDGEQRTWLAAYDLRHPDRDVMPLAEGSVRAHLAEQPFQYLHADRITPAVTYPRSHQIAVARGFLGVRGEHTVDYLRHHTDQDVPTEVPDGPLRHRDAISPNSWTRRSPGCRSCAPVSTSKPIPSKAPTRSASPTASAAPPASTRPVAGAPPTSASASPTRCPSWSPASPRRPRA